MSLRIYLEDTRGAEEVVERLLSEERIQSYRLLTREKGGKILQFNNWKVGGVGEIPNKFTSSTIPSVEEVTDHLTYKEYFYVGFRPDGIYEVEGARARLEKRIHKSKKDNDLQWISITADSLEALEEIYKQIRRQKDPLRPVVSFEGEIIHSGFMANFKKIFKTKVLRQGL